MENKTFVLILLTLVVLIALALWQFYSLAWGGTRWDGYTAGRQDVGPQEYPPRRSVPAVSPR